MILRSITSRPSDILVPLYKALVRPILEYASVVWCPYLKKDKQRIETVQRHFTKNIEGMNTLEYEERLRKLNLPTLEFRRLRGDLIETYKITHTIYDPLTTKTLFSYDVDERTRSHTLKFYKTRFNKTKFQNFFTNRVINIWNTLPKLIVTSESLNIFKNRVDLHFYEYKFMMDIRIEEAGL